MRNKRGRVCLVPRPYIRKITYAFSYFSLARIPSGIGNLKQVYGFVPKATIFPEELGMDNYQIAPEGNGFRVCRTSPDGQVCLVGRFPTKDNAQLWIKDQVRMTGRRDAAPRRFADQRDKSR
jgi:hypothetical protein